MHRRGRGGRVCGAGRQGMVRARGFGVPSFLVKSWVCDLCTLAALKATGPVSKAKPSDTSEFSLNKHGELL